MSEPAIPEKWIKEYVDRLINIAKEFNDGPMRNAAGLRADHIMEMVEAWREHQKKNAGS